MGRNLSGDISREVSMVRKFESKMKELRRGYLQRIVSDLKRDGISMAYMETFKEGVREENFDYAAISLIVTALERFDSELRIADETIDRILEVTGRDEQLPFCAYGLNSRQKGAASAILAFWGYLKGLRPTIVVSSDAELKERMKSLKEPFDLLGVEVNYSSVATYDFESFEGVRVASFKMISEEYVSCEGELFASGCDFGYAIVEDIDAQVGLARKGIGLSVANFQEPVISTQIIDYIKGVPSEQYYYCDEEQSLVLAPEVILRAEKSGLAYEVFRALFVAYRVMRKGMDYDVVGEEIRVKEKFFLSVQCTLIGVALVFKEFGRFLPQFQETFEPLFLLKQFSRVDAGSCYYEGMECSKGELSLMRVISKNVVALGRFSPEVYLEEAAAGKVTKIKRLIEEKAFENIAIVAINSTAADILCKEIEGSILFDAGFELSAENGNRVVVTLDYLEDLMALGDFSVIQSGFMDTLAGDRMICELCADEEGPVVVFSLEDSLVTALLEDSLREKLRKYVGKRVRGRYFLSEVRKAQERTELYYYELAQKYAKENDRNHFNRYILKRKMAVIANENVGENIVAGILSQFRSCMVNAESQEKAVELFSLKYGDLFSVDKLKRVESKERLVETVVRKSLSSFSGEELRDLARIVQESLYKHYAFYVERYRLTRASVVVSVDGAENSAIPAINDMVQFSLMNLFAWLEGINRGREIQMNQELADPVIATDQEWYRPSIEKQVLPTYLAKVFSGDREVLNYVCDERGFPMKRFLEEYDLEEDELVLVEFIEGGYLIGSIKLTLPESEEGQQIEVMEASA